MECTLVNVPQLVHSGVGFCSHHKYLIQLMTVSIAVVDDENTQNMLKNGSVIL